MRLPLPTDLKTRTGAPDKDARLKNCYVEMKGNDPAQAGVRKRAVAGGGTVIGTGIAQGGIGFNIGNTPFVITFNGDVGTVGGGDSAGAFTGIVGYYLGDNRLYTTTAGPYGVGPVTIDQVAVDGAQNASVTYTKITDPADPYFNKYIMMPAFPLPLLAGEYFVATGAYRQIIAYGGGGYIVNGNYGSPINWGAVGSNSPNVVTTQDITSVGIVNQIQSLRNFVSAYPAQQISFTLFVVSSIAPFTVRYLNGTVLSQPIKYVMNGTYEYRPPPLNDLRIRSGVDTSIIIASSNIIYLPVGLQIGVLPSTTKFYFTAI